MSRDLSGWLPGLLGPLDVQGDGTAWAAKRGTLNFRGVDGYITVAVSDDDANERANVSFTLGTVPTTKGGTGLTSIGSALQVLRVNAGGTALEWGTVSAGGSPAGNNDEVQVKSGSSFAAAANVKAGSSYVSIGATPASAGAVRLSNATAITARNAANNADIGLVESDGANTVTVGNGAGAGILQGATSQGFYNGSAYTLLAYGGQLASLYPIVGSSSPYGVHGVATYAVTDSGVAQGPSSAEYALGILRFTGALTADRTVTFPAPATDAEGYSKIVRNDCTGSNLVVSTGAGADVTMAPGTSAILVFDASVGVWEAVV